MLESIFYTLLYLGYYLIGFVLMPYLALKKSKSKILMLLQISLSIFWGAMLVSYFIDIPEGESGFVIVGMLFILPIFCLFTQLICLGLRAVVVKVSNA